MVLYQTFCFIAGFTTGIPNDLADKIGSIFSIDPQIWMYIDAKNELSKFQKENKISSKKYSLDGYTNVFHIEFPNGSSFSPSQVVSP